MEREAGTTACKRLPGFYRLDRLSKCTLCEFNDTVTLSPGFFWKWQSQADLREYFAKALQSEYSAVKEEHFKVRKSLPTAVHFPMSIEGIELPLPTLPHWNPLWCLLDHYHTTARNARQY